MSTFRFKHFKISQANAPLKVGTDAMILGALSQFDLSKSILDIGTGTGVLAIMQAQKYSNCCIDGIELDEAAFCDAEENFKNAPFQNLRRVFHADFQNFIPVQSYDGFICNPPFYVDALKGKNAQLNLAKHVDQLPLKSLVKQATKMANPKAVFWIIWPFSDRLNMVKDFESSGWNLQSTTTILGKPNHPVRIVAQWCLDEANTTQESELTVRDANGHYTQAYIDLTKDFHDRDLSR